MRILITGAVGNFARGLIDQLTGTEHELVLTDQAELSPSRSLPFEYHQVDLRDGQGLSAAVENVNLVVHTAAWHGIHETVRSESDFWALNVDGTRLVAEQARRVEAAVLFLSSQAIYEPRGIYGFSKRVAESIFGYYHENYGLGWVALRPGSFTPWKDDWSREYGVRLLTVGVDRRDVLDAATRSVDYLASNPHGELVVDVVRENPLAVDQLDDWKDSPIETAEKVFPGSRKVIEALDLDISQAPRISPTAGWSELGFHPRYHFGTFVNEVLSLSAIDDARRVRCPYA